jgi:hypothetical protein
MNYNYFERISERDPAQYLIKSFNPNRLKINC